jgi:hypothetical protein
VAVFEGAEEEHDNVSWDEVAVGPRDDVTEWCFWD